ncbi:MAG TPA: NAD-dependent epimerase/dehydratase family protein [Thermoanaerobaculia bacterium]
MAPRSGKPVLVITGSSGLIGTRLIQAFASKFDVVGLDVKPPPAEARAAAFLECDLTKEASVKETVARLRREHGEKIASVIHLAAYYDFSGEPSPLYRKLTVEGTGRLLRALRGLEVEQFVFSSSLLVMEPAEEGEEITEESPEKAAWDYPKSKLAAERVIARERGDIPAVILRIAGVYDEDCHSIPIGQQITRIYEKDLESFFFPGDADHGQPFVHLDDLVSCVERVVERRVELGKEDLFLIAEPDIVTYAEMQDRLGRLLHGREWPTIRIPKVAAKVGAWAREKTAGEEKTFIKPWMVDLADDHYPVVIAHAREELGWNPTHRLRETLPAMVESLRKDPKRWYEINGFPLPEEAAVKEERAERAGPSRLAAAEDLDVPAPPWSYNPSSWRHRVPICILAAVAFLIATYMALYQWRLIDSVWDPVFGEQSARVLDSDVSEKMRRVFRMPDAALGALAYLGDLLFGLAGSTRRWQYRPWLVLLFGLDVIPLGLVSVILVVLQGTTVGAWCFLCLVTAAISLTLVALAYDEVWSSILYLRRVAKKTGDARAVWRAFWGRPSKAAQSAALPERRAA